MNKVFGSVFMLWLGVSRIRFFKISNYMFIKVLLLMCGLVFCKTQWAGTTVALLLDFICLSLMEKI